MLDTEDLIRQDNDRDMNNTELTSIPVNGEAKMNDQLSRKEQLREETDSQLRSLIDGLTRHTPKQVSDDPSLSKQVCGAEKYLRSICELQFY